MIINLGEREGYSEYKLICDYCRKEIGGFQDFYDAVDYKKENGWKSIKILGEWTDACPKCKGEIE